LGFAKLFKVSLRLEKQFLAVHSPEAAYLWGQTPQDMLTVILLAVAVVLSAFFLFSLRILLIKGGQFRGTCANNNPFLRKEGATCGVCGRAAGEPCGKEESTLVVKKQSS